MASTRARLPTPDSAESSNSNKRRKISDAPISGSSRRGHANQEVGVFEDDEEADNAGYDDDVQQSLPTPVEAEIDGYEAQGRHEEEESSLEDVEDAGEAEDDEEEPALRYYNPHQNPEKRRQIRTSYRTLQREVEGKIHHFHLAYHV